MTPAGRLSKARLLMCRPTYYTIAYEINPWMSVKRQANAARARAQWNALYRLLTGTLGVDVRLLPPRAGVPDLVFTANAGLVQGRTFIRSNFRYLERQKEEPVFEGYFRRAGYRVTRLSGRYRFEGEGDALWLGDTLLYGFRFRSDAPAHEELAAALSARVLPLELADTRFYHLDTCLCPLDAATVLWYPKAFDRYGRSVVGNLAETISVTEAEAKRFVCNTIVLPGPQGTDLVMQEGASASLKRQLTRRGFRLHLVDLSEFLKAGGSAKCLVLTLPSR
jgi:N-dimethylarginine dimethylaminohydrolase